jgi:hypothetical protein
MSALAVEITSFVFTNNFGTGITLVLEPEGDCIELAEGQACTIIPAMLPASKLECELVLGLDKSITLYLPMVKDVYVDSVKVR